jgi:hypothetical protein
MYNLRAMVVVLVLVWVVVLGLVWVAWLKRILSVLDGYIIKEAKILRALHG